MPLLGRPPTYMWKENLRTGYAEVQRAALASVSLTNSQLMKVVDASVQKIQNTDGQHRPAPNTDSRRKRGNRWLLRRRSCRTDLLEVSTCVKDVRNTSRTKSPRGDARVTTVRNTCITNELTERPPPEAFRSCFSEIAGSAANLELFALKAAWAELMQTFSSRDDEV